MIDDRGSTRCGGCFGCVRRIGRRSLRTVGRITASANGAHAPPAAQQLGDDSASDPAGPAKDDMSRIDLHGPATR